MGLAGLVAMIRYVPYPVTTGFTSGIALTIAVMQLRDFFGLNVHYERVRQISEPFMKDGQTAQLVTSVTETVRALPDHFHEKLACLFHAFSDTPVDTVLHTGVIGFVDAGRKLILYPRALAKRSQARAQPADCGAGFQRESGASFPHGSRLA